MEAARGSGSLTSSGVWGNEGRLFTARLAGGSIGAGRGAKGAVGWEVGGTGVQGSGGEEVCYWLSPAGVSGISEACVHGRQPV